VVNVEKEFKCFRCGSEKIVKRGKVFNTKKTLWRQQYACKNCNYKFLSKKQHIADTYEPSKFVYQEQPLPVIDWSAYNLAQLNEKQLFLQLLNNVLEIFEFEPLQRTGRPTANIRDVLYCMVMKNYIKNSSRRTISDLKLLKELNCIETIPCFTTLMKYFNDSKATTPESTIAALNAFSNPIILIAGGYNKKVSFLEMAALVTKKAKHLILIGQTAKKIALACEKQDLTFVSSSGREKCKIHFADSLEKAVKQAHKFSRLGDIVLLSPACASYDMFKNFKERGEKFKYSVNKIANR